jgi:hypothetical protein
MATQAAKQLIHALLNLQPARPFYQVGEEQMLVLKRLAAIFKGALPARKKDATYPLLEINDDDALTRVQIAVSPPKVINGATSSRVIQPTVTNIKTPNSHQRLIPTPARAVTPNIPHSVVRRSAHQQNLSNDMLAETVPQSNHVFSLPTGPTIRSPTNKRKDTPIIIIPEMANTVICPDTGNSLKHQELINM